MSLITQARQKNTLVPFAVLFGLWLLLVYAPLFSAMQIWATNDIYNHCLIVIPAALYLIFERRKEIQWANMQMSWLAAILFVGQILFYALSTAADIQLFQHAAIFAMLPTLLWLFLGNRIAWDCKFPLAFILFAIPVGEELIPFLQEITADMAVAMLEFTGIPLFRSGLFIEIPQGKFLVAEACSGVSFLIASIVLGNLYAYMNLRTWKRRILFVGLSILFPILANAVRVYGIIYIGYASDMEHAVGADHLVYGWFFFAFVLVCLFLIGELVKKNEKASLGKTSANSSVNVHDIPVNIDEATPGLTSLSLPMFILCTVFLVGALVQVFRMQNVDMVGVEGVSFKGLNYQSIKHSPRLSWEPRFVGNSQQEMQYLHASDKSIDFDLYYAYFNGTDGELVSSLNRLYEQDRWTLSARQRIQIGDAYIQKDNISSSIGTHRRIYYWYLVDGQLVDTYREVKFKQLIQRLKGVQSHSAIIAIGFDWNSDALPNEEHVEQIVADVLINANLNMAIDQ
ncbi:exosortase A [Glaciecola petra]|uniref:Exosortase A n=1 Tax=Glaciecola petra TaxID=3075602 RepID=A0ABU2ZPS3_9ALTE|nr:exosortase A [Aestuariibacter sp. P117]MDT0593599.1 exosortase A [Aestuariibacter sp. P117]